jgi:DNA-binding NarL/FixJ family response regulator
MLTTSLDEPRFQMLILRLCAAADMPGFCVAIKAILIEAIPQERDLTSYERELLSRLHFHVEAAAQRVSAREKQAIPNDSGPALPSSAVLCQLTRAERDIVGLVRQGWSNKEIATHLEKSVRTVKTQLTGVYKKFKVRSRSRLMAILS